VGGRLRVMARVLGNPSLRRVELAFLGFGAAEMGVWVAVLVYAYRHGGTATAAAIAAIQLVPAAALAPAAAELADRRGRAVTLAASYWIQAAALLGTGAAFLAGAPAVVGYGCATVAACAVTLTRPAQAALVPQLVRTPSELTAVNVTSGWVESASMLLGPAAAGMLISIHGAGLAVAGFGTVLVACALAADGLERGAGKPGALVVPKPPPHGAQRTGLLGLLLGDRPRSVLLALFFLQFVALGAMDVLVVVLALGHLHLSSGGAGYLESMFGVGAVLGGFLAVVLVGHRRLALPVLAAAAVWGASLVAMAGLGTAAAIFVLLAVVGASRTVFDVSGRTLLHRAVAPHIHARMFGALEGLQMAGLAVGSITVPVLVAAGGTSAALIGIGAALMLGSAAPLTALGRIVDSLGAPVALIDLLRRTALFAMLGAPVLEDLARALEPLSVPDGEDAVREGEPGDRYYVVADGRLAVTIGGELVRTLHPTDGFGEIALLRDGIRRRAGSARGGQQRQLAALGQQYALARPQLSDLLEMRLGDRLSLKAREDRRGDGMLGGPQMDRELDRRHTGGGVEDPEHGGPPQIGQRAQARRVQGRVVVAQSDPAAGERALAPRERGRSEDGAHDQTVEHGRSAGKPAEGQLGRAVRIGRRLGGLAPQGRRLGARGREDDRCRRGQALVLHQADLGRAHALASAQDLDVEVGRPRDGCLEVVGRKRARRRGLRPHLGLGGAQHHGGQDAAVGGGGPVPLRAQLRGVAPRGARGHGHRAVKERGCAAGHGGPG
jgi:hypothetical protein